MPCSAAVVALNAADYAFRIERVNPLDFIFVSCTNRQMIKPSDIARARRQLGETQAEFAVHFGVCQTTVHRWEKIGVSTRVTTQMAMTRILSELKKSRK